jgi:diacylglycerol kinase (ATP)
MARDAIAGGAALIIAAGGDGTINETAQGMLHTGVPLGILPAGTANVLATEMRLGRGFERAAEALVQSRPHRVAVGRLSAEAAEPRCFLLMAGVGLDAHVVHRVNPVLKARTGKFAYWVAGWSLVGRSLPEFRVAVDGREVRCSFALAARVRNYGGDFEIARETTLFDDSFEVVLFAGSSAARYIKYFGGMIANRLRGMNGVTVLRARELTVAGPEDRDVYIQIDGEFAGRLPARIEIVPDALTLMIPPGYAGPA